MFIVVFTTRDTTNNQDQSSKISELSSKIEELSSTISELSPKKSRYIDSKPVVKFEATRDSNETIKCVSCQLQ